MPTHRGFTSAAAATSCMNEYHYCSYSTDKSALKWDKNAHQLVGFGKTLRRSKSQIRKRRYGRIPANIFTSGLVTLTKKTHQTPFCFAWNVTHLSRIHEHASNNKQFNAVLRISRYRAMWILWNTVPANFRLKGAAFRLSQKTESAKLRPIHTRWLLCRFA